MGRTRKGSTDTIVITQQTIHEYVQKFTYDWQNYQTQLSVGAIYKDLKFFLKKFGEIERFLLPSEKKIFGELHLKLGLFYAHAKNNFDKAISHLKIAEKILKNIDLIWTHLHLSFSYIKKAFLTSKKNEAEYFLNYGIPYHENAKEKLMKEKLSETNEISLNQLHAFQLSMEALINEALDQSLLALNRENTFKLILDAYQKSIQLYEVTSQQNDYYASIKLHYIKILLKNKRQVSEKHFIEIQSYWLNYQKIHEETYHPGAVKFYEFFGDFLKEKKPELALTKYKAAYKMAKNFSSKKLCSQLKSKINDLNVTPLSVNHCSTFYQEKNALKKDAVKNLSQAFNENLKLKN